MSKEEQITELKTKIQAVLEEYEKEYQALADRSEVLYDEEAQLKQAYETLDEKSGLRILFEELARLKEGE
jgi:hypothetical protein